MANLSDEDYRLLMGDDFKRRLSNNTVVSEHATDAEKTAARKKRIEQLASVRFSFYALAFTGLALVWGALYTGVGFSSVQSQIGLAMVAAGLTGVVVTTLKSKSIGRENALA